MPTERLRIAPPPVEPVPPQHSLIQVLFPVVGGVGIFGFALVYGNSLFLYIALSKGPANLGMAKFQLSSVEQKLS